MPFISAEQIPGEPIVVGTLRGHINANDVHKVVVANANYLEQHEGHLFSIVDVREIKTAFPDVMMIIRNAGQGKPGSSSDPRVKVLLVGDSDFAKLFTAAMERQQIKIPMFTDLNEAIEFARGAK